MSYFQDRPAACYPHLITSLMATTNKANLLTSSCARDPLLGTSLDKQVDLFCARRSLNFRVRLASATPVGQEVSGGYLSDNLGFLI